MNQEHFYSLASAVGQCGVSAQEAGEALKSLANTMKFTIGKPLDIPENKEFYNGEVLYDPETSTCYVYNNGSFITISEEATMKANYENKIEQQPVNGNLNMNLYDLNKAAVLQLPSYSEADKQVAKELINSYDDFAIITRYYMLLCRELNYYTVFQRQFNAATHENFGDVVIECLENLGDIKSIDLTETRDAIEAWVVDPNEHEAYVAYLFNYDQGVIICE